MGCVAEDGWLAEEDTNRGREKKEKEGDSGERERGMEEKRTLEVADEERGTQTKERPEVRSLLTPYFHILG